MARIGILALTSILAVSCLIAPSGTSAPTVSGISPSSDDTNGGIVVAVAGNGFAPGLSVTFGGTPAVLVGDVAPNEFDVIVPPRATTGAVDVVVTNPDGSSTTFGKGFTYTSIIQPAFIRIGPMNNGSTNGGQMYHLDGQRFPDPATKAYRPTVTFGGLRAEVIDTNSDHQLFVKAPPHPAGIVDVVVTNPDGKGMTLAGGFTYVAAPPPNLISASPASGPSTGQELVTIQGTNISVGATVAIGGLIAPVVQPPAEGCTTSCMLNVVSPPHAPGRVDIVLQNPDGQSVNRTGWHQYNAAPGPIVTPVTQPWRGPTVGGTLVCLDGLNFAGGASATLGGVDALEVHTNHGGDTVDGDCPSDKDLSLVTPSHAVGVVDLEVTNPDGQAITRTGIFEYVEAIQLFSSSPTSGTCNGGTTVTLTGLLLGPGSQAFFGAMPALQTIGSGTTLTAVSPPGSCTSPETHLDITVRNAAGMQATLADAFSYLTADPPALAGTDWVSNPSASTNGGTALTIHGSGFFTGPTKPTVHFGDAPALVGAVTSTTLQVTVPTVASHETGNVDVVVENPGGQTSQTGKPFTYTTALAPGAPSISGLAASTSNGGPSVTLASEPGRPFAVGSNDTTALLPWVCVGDEVPDPECTGGLLAEVKSATPASMTFLAPTIPGGSGPQPVYVIHPDGQVGPPAASAATYTLAAPPSITSRTPSEGPTLGWTPITLTGTGFATGDYRPTVLVGGIEARITASSTTSITALAPAHAVGTAEVAVINPDGQAAIADSFTYILGPSPKITGSTSTSAPRNGGSLVTLTGEFPNFVPETAPSGFRVNGFPTHEFTVVSPTVLVFQTPAIPEGLATLSIMNLDGQSGALVDAMRYLPLPPVLKSVTTGPVGPFGPANGGTSIEVHGEQLDRVIATYFGNKLAPLSTTLDNGSLQIQTPAKNPGPAPLTVFDDSGQSSTLRNAFTFVDAPPPTIRTAFPAAGPALGGTWLQITGTGFAQEAVVEFGSIRSELLTLVSADGTFIIVLVPSHEAGPTTLTVVNPDGDAGSMANGFTFIGQGGAIDQLAVTQLTPSSGPTAGGTPVVIRGAGFASTTSVKFGALNATSVIVHNSTTLTAITPPQGAGAVNVIVTLASKAVTKQASFTYTVPPLNPPSTSIGTDEGTPTTPDPLLSLTSNQVFNANKRVKMTVARAGIDNIVSWELPNLTPASVVGVQVWRGNSPYQLVQDIPASSDAYTNRTIRDTGLEAKETTRYLVTLYYGQTAALGRFNPQNGPDPKDYAGFSATGTGTTKANGLSGWGMAIIGGAAVFVAIAVALILRWSKKRKNSPEAALHNAYAWDEGREASGHQIHQARCPQCTASFVVAGGRPLATMCPGCGTKGTLR